MSKNKITRERETESGRETDRDKRERERAGDYGEEDNDCTIARRELLLNALFSGN